MILAALILALCPPGPRDNCIVDGDTLWLAGEKIRIADIDAPELHGQCPSEIDLARRATLRLRDLMSAEPFTVHREGRDRYGRTLAVLTNGRGSIGDQLVSEGLARTWSGRRELWCR
jgi:endonuclease YncB( thermonuclease family)